jgi:hypothetical protein
MKNLTCKVASLTGAAEAKALDYIARAFPRTAVTLLAWNFDLLMKLEGLKKRYCHKCTN